MNYTGTYLAGHLAGLQHDNVQYFLKATRFTLRQLWQQVRGEFVGSARGYELFDDTVPDKRHSQRIELVRRQVKGMPKESKLKPFRVLVSTHRTDYLITNARYCLIHDSGSY